MGPENEWNQMLSFSQPATCMQVRAPSCKLHDFVKCVFFKLLFYKD